MIELTKQEERLLREASLQTFAKLVPVRRLESGKLLANCGPGTVCVIVGRLLSGDVFCHPTEETEEEEEAHEL